MLRNYWKSTLQSLKLIGFQQSSRKEDKYAEIAFFSAKKTIGMVSFL